jgi:hypothetical protein
MSETTASSSSGNRPSTGNPRIDRMLQGMMGATHLVAAQVEGGVLTVKYGPADSYFVNDEFVARLAIGAAFGLLYRCGLNEVRFHFVRDGQEVQLHVTKEGFNVFFKLTEEQMTRLATDPARFDASPVHMVSEARQWEFYLHFTKDD